MRIYVYHTEISIKMSEDFEGPYPERVDIPEEYIIERGLDDTIYDGVDNFYYYVDMIYEMFFEEEINPYTGKPYVINPRLSPQNMYTLRDILDEGMYQYRILYDLPTNDPDIYKTVELTITYTFCDYDRYVPCS